MSRKHNELYEFGNFRLDVGEHKLVRLDGEAIGSIPEKAFQTLIHLVRNSGNLLTKDELLTAVWPDAFVEENNLDKNIHAIRHFLGDRASEQQYIQTVRKHGYRFVANVRVVAGEGVRPAVTEFAESPAPPLYEGNTETPLPISINEALPNAVPVDASNGGGRWRYKPGRVNSRVAVAAAILILGLGMMTWLVRGNRETAFATIIAAPFSSEKLSADGQVQHAVVSPDGNFVVYSHGIIGEKQSVWQRSLETGHNTEVIPPSDDIYFGLALSPEDNTLFFARRPGGREGPADITVCPAPVAFRNESFQRLRVGSTFRRTADKSHSSAACTDPTIFVRYGWPTPATGKTRESWLRGQARIVYGTLPFHPTDPLLRSDPDNRKTPGTTSECL